MPVLRRRPPVAGLPARLIALIPAAEQVLGAVPLSRDGARWAVATPVRLLILDRDGVDVSYHWDRVSHGAWSADDRALTLELLDDPGTLVLCVPERIEDGNGPAADAGEAETVPPTSSAVDDKPFALALRQRVNAAVVHHVSGQLPSGATGTASVRRRSDGSLYCVTKVSGGPGSSAGGAARELEADDARALAALERRACDGVGLPTP